MCSRPTRRRTAPRSGQWGLAGPGQARTAHDAKDEVFIVTEGTMWFLAGEEWVEAPAGTFLRIPAGVTHDFENRGAEPVTAFNVFIPGGGFEADFARWAS